MQVKLLIPMASARRAYNVGDLFPCDADEAERLVSRGLAEHVQQARAQPLQTATKKRATEKAARVRKRK